MPEDPNRKTTLPVKGIPQIVEFLLDSASESELEWMAGMADSKNSSFLKTIFTKLTDYNIHEVFYQPFSTTEELSIFRASKRGEVAGLKAFQMACQQAKEELKRRNSKEV